MLLIRNINLISMKDNRIEQHTSILIKDDRIEAISPLIRAHEGEHTIIEGNNRYLIPGLINSHTHLGDNPDDLLLYLANGITTIRNMWGYEGFKLMHWLFGTRVFDHLELKRRISSGKETGTNIFTPGPILDGDPPFFPKFMYVKVITNEAEAERAVRYQSEKGYDFIKVYSKLSAQAFDHIMQASSRHGMPVCGHIPDDVPLEHAILSHIHSIEHLYGFINPYKPHLNIARGEYGRMAGLCAAHGVWNCPTLIAHERLSDPDRQEEFENEEQMAYVSGRNKKAMRFLADAAAKMYKKSGIPGNHFYMDDFFAVVRELKKSGAGILLGTDKSVPYVVAGFSEHKEIQLLSKAGLDNYEILKAATINGAKCLRSEDTLGTIEPGKKADMIITEKNPLEDISTVSRHMGVIKSGFYYPREKCDEMLERVRSRVN